MSFGSKKDFISNKVSSLHFYPRKCLVFLSLFKIFIYDFKICVLNKVGIIFQFIFGESPALL